MFLQLEYCFLITKSFILVSSGIFMISSIWGFPSTSSTIRYIILHHERWNQPRLSCTIFAKLWVPRSESVSNKITLIGMVSNFIIVSPFHPITFGTSNLVVSSHSWNSLGQCCKLLFLKCLPNRSFLQYEVHLACLLLSYVDTYVRGGWRDFPLLVSFHRVPRGYVGPLLLETHVLLGSSSAGGSPEAIDPHGEAMVRDGPRRGRRGEPWEWSDSSW